MDLDARAPARAMSAHSAERGALTFKDQAAADLPTFLNVAEFADTIDIDGVGTVAGVLMNDEAPGAADDDGVSQLEQTLYARASDFLDKPVVRQRLVLDGRQANVTRVDEEQGVYVIRLRWFDS